MKKITILFLMCILISSTVSAEQSIDAEKIFVRNFDKYEEGTADRLFFEGNGGEAFIKEYEQENNCLKINLNPKTEKYRYRASEGRVIKDKFVFESKIEFKDKNVKTDFILISRDFSKHRLFSIVDGRLLVSEKDICTLETNKFYRIAFAADGNSVEIFVDNQSKGIAESEYDLSSTGVRGALLEFSSERGGEVWIDDIRIYNSSNPVENEYLLLTDIQKAEIDFPDDLIFKTDSAVMLFKGQMRNINDYNYNLMPQEKGGKIYLPVRYTAECMGYSLQWNDSGQYTEINGYKFCDGDGHSFMYMNNIYSESEYIAEAMKSNCSIFEDGLVVIGENKQKAEEKATLLKAVSEILKKNRFIDLGYAFIPEPRKNSYRVYGVSASGSDQNLPQYIADGDLSTRWSANAAEAKQWITLDLGEIKSVGEIDVAVHNGDARKNIFTLYVSEDNEKWIQVYDGESSGISKKYEVIKIPMTNARYIKYEGQGADVSTYCSVAEISVAPVQE